MAFDVIASSYREREKERTPLGHAVIAGISFGATGIFAALVGILSLFHERWIVAWLPEDAADPSGLTLGQSLLLVFAMWAGVQVVRKTGEERLGPACLLGAGAGLVAGAVLCILPFIMSLVKLRFMFISLTPQLYEMLTSGLGDMTEMSTSGVPPMRSSTLPAGVRRVTSPTRAPAASRRPARAGSTPRRPRSARSRRPAGSARPRR